MKTPGFLRARPLGGEWQCAVHGTRALLQALELSGACTEPREGPCLLPRCPDRPDNEDSQGDRHALAASDLWSCAIVIYVALGLFSRLLSTLDRLAAGVVASFTSSMFVYSALT